MLDCTNGKFFSLGLLRSYGLVCAACVGLANPAMAQVDLDAWADDPPASNATTETDGSDDLAGKVAVSAYSTVDIHVQNTDLAKVLQMLSIQSQRNIIVSKNVSGTVSADLYDVTFFEALDAILNSNGYGYIEEGAFIKVYTLEELRAIKEAARQLAYRRFELSYLNSTDASIFVQPLLSDKGTIAISADVDAGLKPDESNGGADNWANAATLVVHDYEENIEEIARLIGELDIRPQQVLVEATVLQSSLNEDNAFGVDWSILADVNFSDFTNPLSIVDDLITGAGDGGFQPGDNKATAIRSNVGQTQRAGGLKIGVISDDISVFLRVLDEVVDTTVISRPRVLAVNRNRGQILIGRKIGYLSTTSTETSTTQTVQFLDTGTQLIFRPFVGKDGFIRMELKPSVSEGIVRDVTGSDGSTFTIPDQITQELQTNVVVRDGYTIVLGGLFREETTLTRRQVPVLGDIPIIGAAFKGKEDATRRSEITFLITPSIMRDEVLIAEGSRANELVNDARFAARNGVLWWSNDRLTSNHNLAAEEAIAAGDFELALWHIDCSLHLHPDQPLVIEMRERLLGKSEKWFNGSMMRHLTDERIKASMDLKNTTEKTASVPTEFSSDPLLGPGSADANPLDIESLLFDDQPEPTPASDVAPAGEPQAEPATGSQPTEEPGKQSGAPETSGATKTASASKSGKASKTAKAGNAGDRDISWGATNDPAQLESDTWWEDFTAAISPEGFEVWQLTQPESNGDQGVAINPDGDPCLLEAAQGGSAVQVAQFNAQVGQSLAILQSLSPMGTMHFGPVFANYQAWLADQQTLTGYAEVPTEGANDPIR